MTFLGLIVHNVAARRLRATLTGAAVAIAVMAVVALGTLTSSTTPELGITSPSGPCMVKLNRPPGCSSTTASVIVHAPR